MGRFGFLFTRLLQAPGGGAGKRGCGEGTLRFHERSARRLQAFPLPPCPAPHPRRARCSTPRPLLSSPPGAGLGEAGLGQSKGCPEQIPRKKKESVPELSRRNKWRLRLDPHRPAPTSRGPGGPRGDAPAWPAGSSGRAGDAGQRGLKAQPAILPPAVPTALEKRRERDRENANSVSRAGFRVRGSSDAARRDGTVPGSGEHRSYLHSPRPRTRTRKPPGPAAPRHRPVLRHRASAAPGPSTRRDPLRTVPGGEGGGNNRFTANPTPGGCQLHPSDPQGSCVSSGKLVSLSVPSPGAAAVASGVAGEKENNFDLRFSNTPESACDLQGQPGGSWGPGQGRPSGAPPAVTRARAHPATRWGETQVRHFPGGRRGTKGRPEPEAPEPAPRRVCALPSLQMATWRSRSPPPVPARPRPSPPVPARAQLGGPR